MDINILILSVGTRNKIVQYFKKELNEKGKVYATDSSKLAPALYEADEYFIVPRVDEPKYLETILNICEENKINGILSLIDPELNVLSKYKNKFLDIGTTPIISNYEAVQLSFNKYNFNEFLKTNGFNYIKSYIDIKNFKEDFNEQVIKFPVFVKPVEGSASLNINLVETMVELEILFNRYNNLIIQEFIDGIEYGVDVYIDMISKQPVNIFIKEKLKMRAGETDKSVSVKDKELKKLIKNFVTVAGYKGIIDIDVFKIKGEYYISEVNPRFGGGYPHAYECGVNIHKQIIRNLSKQINPIGLNDYDEGISMMKYSDLKIDKTIGDK